MGAAYTYRSSPVHHRPLILGGFMFVAACEYHTLGSVIRVVHRAMVRAYGRDAAPAAVALIVALCMTPGEEQ
jgi:hypothetical protein